VVRPKGVRGRCLLHRVLTIGVAVALASCGTSPRTAITVPSTPHTRATPTVPSGSSFRTVRVDGRSIPVFGPLSVWDALAIAGITPRDGRLLSVVRRRVLDAHFEPAKLFVDGRPAGLQTPVQAGDVITITRGRDRVEKTERVEEAVGPDPSIAGLYTGGAPGVAQVVRGVISHEQVSWTLVREATLGHLRSPASVALTFDDGPSSPYTSQVLALLAAHDAPAVFCLIGREASAHPDLVRQIVAAGDQLCDHTQDHLNLLEVSKAAMTQQIEEGYTSIEQASGGAVPVSFRAPGGNWSAAIETEARAEHMVPLHWTVDPTDWARPGASAIVSRVVDHLRPGGIVLLHDGGGDRSQTVAALAQLLAELSALGWTFSLPSWVR
jgi:peptidoglycan-N-acetylglucosamine deacetylase